ncbi:LysR family transcriptional regulator, partial [Escherichia coli]|nr:LysR family transcriptional regulator [Escherichia coli]EGE1559919.1 LysR family transcriptional regulator [Escherichia coli]
FCVLDLQTAPVLVASKSLKRSPKAGAAHMDVG